MNRLFHNFADDKRRISGIKSEPIEIQEKIIDINNPEYIYEIQRIDADVYEIDSVAGRANPVRKLSKGDIITVYHIDRDSSRLYINKEAPLRFVKMSTAIPYKEKALSEQAKEYFWRSILWAKGNPLKASLGLGLMFVGSAIIVKRLKNKIKNNKK